MNHWTIDAGSLFAIGRTQTGKTTLCREVHAENQRVSIWLNEQGKHRVPNVAGKRVRSLKAVQSGFANDIYKYNWLSNDRQRDIQALYDWLWNVADRSNRKLPVQVVVDELHRLCPQSQKDTLPGRDEIRHIAKEGQKRNVKLVGITQDPVAMDKQTLRQREYLAVFPLAAEQGNYIRDYGVDMNLVDEQPEYAGVVFHAKGNVVEKGVKAKAKYG